MIIIPAVDVLDGAVVRLHQGKYDNATVYAGDPSGQVMSFSQAGAEIVHVVDLAAARSGSITAGLWEDVTATGVPIQAGGGVRSAGAARTLLEAGVSRVVVGTAAVRPDGPLEEIVTVTGPARLVVGLDVRDGRVRGSGWTDEGRPLDEVIGRLVAAGVRRALVTGIQTDGTMAGPDHRLLEEVRRSAPDLAIIASGGVGSLTDVSALAASGWEAAIVGRALYEGVFSLTDAIATAAGSTE